MAFIISDTLVPGFWAVNEEGTNNTAVFNSLEQAEYWCTENSIQYTVDVPANPVV